MHNALTKNQEAILHDFDTAIVCKWTKSTRAQKKIRDDGTGDALPGLIDLSIIFIFL